MGLPYALVFHPIQFTEVAVYHVSECRDDVEATSSFNCVKAKKLLEKFLYKIIFKMSEIFRKY